MFHQIRNSLTTLVAVSRPILASPPLPPVLLRVSIPRHHAAVCTCPVLDQSRWFHNNHQSVSHFTPSRAYSTLAIKPSMMVWLRDKFGIRKSRFKRYILRIAGLRLYLCSVELVDYAQFFKELDMDDTFASWFRITELHIWLATVRLAPEGLEGLKVRNHMMKFMWEDIDKRTRKLGPGVSVSARKEGIDELSEQFRGALFAYDEGLISDDKVLAGALWRNFFNMNCKDVRHLELLVQYVRKQIVHIESQETELIIRSGLMTLLPLTGDEEDEKRTRAILNMIVKRSQ